MFTSVIFSSFAKQIIKQINKKNKSTENKIKRTIWLIGDTIVMRRPRYSDHDIH